MSSPRRYTGVTFHKRSGKFEVHLWSSAKNRQLYLGNFTNAEDAARRHDMQRIMLDAKEGRVTKQSRLNFEMPAAVRKRPLYMKLRAYAMATKGGPEGGTHAVRLQQLLFDGDE